VVSDELALSRAVETIRAGEVIALPTDTVYGIGALASNAAATERIFSVKGRRPSVALAVLIAEPESARGLIGVDDEAFWMLAQRFWPGPLTIVISRRLDLDLALGGDGTTIGLRCPEHDLARELLARTGPLAVTSANRSGEPPATSAAEVEEIFGSSLLVLDGGVCNAPPSSVVSLVHSEPLVLREGPIGQEAIRAAISNG
jgi:L-threonylcarbamoyladenylate synthase